jgi:hypothetical protein
LQIIDALESKKESEVNNNFQAVDPTPLVKSGGNLAPYLQVSKPVHPKDSFDFKIIVKNTLSRRRDLT